MGASKAFLRELRRKHGLGEFKKSSSKRHVRRSSGGSMGRKKHYGRKRGGILGGLGGKGMLGAKIGMGIIGTAIAGYVAYLGVKQFAPQYASNDLARAGAGFLVGGPVGAGVAYFAPSIMGKVGGSSSSSASGAQLY